MALSTIPILGNTGSKLAKNAIPIMAIIAVGGVAYVGYKFLKKDDIPPKIDKKNNEPATSLSQIQAIAIADRLYNAMTNVGTGGFRTDTSVIYSSLQGLTYNDFIAVYEAFGKRQYSIFWGNVGDRWTSDNHHLITWLINELNEESIKEIEKIIPNILKFSI